MDSSLETWKRIEDIVKCPICYDMLNDAKFLPCGHTFCQSCLEQYQRNHPSTIGISCPMCKGNTTLSSFRQLSGGLSDLLKNLLAEAVAKVVRNRKQNENAENGPETPLKGQLPAGTTEQGPWTGRKILWKTCCCLGIVLCILIALLSYTATIVLMTACLPETKQLELLTKASVICQRILGPNEEEQQMTSLFQRIYDKIIGRTPKIEEKKKPETLRGKLKEYVKGICDAVDTRRKHLEPSENIPFIP